ncbi:NADPH:quinone reductase [Tersicoccus solisilvae]|uniref:NADPH:quinone reductase n=1 Tax=Tersicoccus solisilvae TaxID=1882339 RepID=A0ABQ1PBM5_9MICC|nr:NADP-dependent oxidoreductase [Tersicoccus solisilvae]GGC94050.1 NADPH:quinone reductase [Tersicoccus solisilvae]
MKAVRFHEHGDPSVLTIEEIEQPVAGSGEVRVRVAASGFNQADNGIRAGSLPIPVTLPHTPGYDVSGTVDAVGEGVSDLAVGDPVIGFLPMTADGAAAEYVVAAADVFVPAPSSIPLTDAAALPSVGLTAWQALFDEAALQANQRLLVVGAGGTVGGYAVELAKRAGAHVIATASPRSRESVLAAGAEQVIDHTTTSVLDAVTEPVDVLLNLAPIDPAEFTSLVGLVRSGGVVVSTTAWMPAPDDEERGVRSAVIFVRSDTEQLRRLVGLVDSGDLHVDVARRVGFDQLAAVHEQSAAGTLRGKVVVVPDAA